MTAWWLSLMFEGKYFPHAEVEYPPSRRAGFPNPARIVRREVAITTLRHPPSQRLPGLGLARTSPREPDKYPLGKDCQTLPAVKFPKLAWVPICMGKSEGGSIPTKVRNAT